MSILSKGQYVVVGAVVILGACLALGFAYRSASAPTGTDTGYAAPEAPVETHQYMDALEEQSTATETHALMPVPAQKESPIPSRAVPTEAGSAVHNAVPVATSTPATSTPQLEPVVWKDAVTTVFWVGEGASSDNGYIHNRASAWDEDWMGTFGGVDTPLDRCGYNPCAFTPRQSPFYVALPYYEYTENGYRRSAYDVPWFTQEALEEGTLLHGRWVAVRHGSQVCYGQWRDVGPFEVADFAYVFGTASAPRNTKGVGAGLDVSPAMRDCLGMDDVAHTAWRFVSETEVPDGPWHN